MNKKTLEKIGIGRRHFNYLLEGKRNAKGRTAIKLQKVLGGPLTVWFDGTAEERRAVYKKFSDRQKLRTRK